MISDDDSRASDVRITREDVVSRIEKLRDCMKNPDNVEQTRILPHQYIERIEINNTKIKVVFKTTFSYFMDDEEYTASYGFESESTRREVLSHNY